MGFVLPGYLDVFCSKEVNSECLYLKVYKYK